MEPLKWHLRHAHKCSTCVQKTCVQNFQIYVFFSVCVAHVDEKCIVFTKNTL